jgi:hypothetical protein
MDECDDGSEGPPAGSFERSVRDLEDVEAALAAEAEANRQKQSDAEDASAELRRRFPTPDEEFMPEPFLLVPFTEGGGGRPIARRPAGEPPLNSAAVTTDADVLVPDESLTIDVHIRNVGGVAAANTHVECYVEHKDASATLDAHSDSDVVQVPRDSSESTTLSGFTTLPEGSEVSIVGYMDHGDIPEGNVPRSSLLYDVRDVVVRADEHRVFETQTSKLGGQDEFFGGFAMPEGRSTFTFRVFDTTDTTTNDLSSVWYSPLLAEYEAEFVDVPNNEKRPLHLESSVSDPNVDRIDKTHATVASNGNASVSFQYTTPEDPPEQWSQSVFYARVYSLASGDMPEDWSRLDHTRSRFVGRRELPAQDG